MHEHKFDSTMERLREQYRLFEKIPRLHRARARASILLNVLFLLFGHHAAFAAPAHQARPAVALDVLRVRAAGNPSKAVVHIPSGPEQVYDCDVVIIGAGMGGVSAALEAAREGITVCMTEPTLWVGGQMTSQGVSAFDGNRWIDSTGATASFAALSRRIRASYYRQLKGAPALKTTDSLTGFNPGKCWVSSLCFQPKRGLAVLESLLKPYLVSGRIHLWVHTVPVRVSRKGRTIASVLAYDFGRRQWLRLNGKYFVDASALGDLIAISGLPYRTGAESRSETGEPDAPKQADPAAVQSFNYPFLMLLHKRPVAGVRKHPPTGYEKFKAKYSMTILNGHGGTLTYKMFEKAPGTPGSFWDYRRLVDAAQFKPGDFAGDISAMNWNSNDYCDAHLLSGNPLEEAEALQQAKQVSLGFAWWLRHEIPRDDGRGRGYPEVQLLRQGMGSADGLSQQPYIRESRRIIPLRTIVEQSIAVKFQPGARAELYPDTVGIGQYPIDVHTCTGKDFTSQTKPYEIPLGALIDRNADNLLAASTDIGTTHITNGAYRLHPTLWSIGEAVGATVAWALQHKTTPAAIDRSRKALLGLQRMLVMQGHPIFWFDDVAPGSPLFAAAQIAAVRGWLPVDGKSLHFDANAPMSGTQVLQALRKSGLARHISAVVLRRIATDPSWKNLPGMHEAGIQPKGPIKRGDFARWLYRKVFSCKGKFPSTAATAAEAQAGAP
jgi:hypothetical protein